MNDPRNYLLSVLAAAAVEAAPAVSKPSTVAVPANTLFRKSSAYKEKYKKKNNN
jgi:hypothetical protein